MPFFENIKTFVRRTEKKKISAANIELRELENILP